MRHFVASLLILLACVVVSGALPAGAVTAWTVTPVPRGTTEADQLSAISCSGSMCMAVGQTDEPGPGTLGLAELWNGSTWTEGTVPAPTGFESLTLAGVSCSSATSCEAVGTDVDSNTFVTDAVAESWNGTKWTLQALSIPAGATASALTAVSCPATVTTCVAVGSYSDSTGDGLTLAEGFNGTAWSRQTTLTPTGADGPTLRGVSCTVSTSAPLFACTAVGDYGDPNTGNGVNIAERWNGSTWAMQTVASSGAFNQLAAVSCPSPAECVAVGSTSATASGSQSLEWNGTTWSSLTIPTPIGGGTDGLDAVSCTSTTSCNAVGSADSATGTLAPFAAVWNATSWTAQAPVTEATFTSEPSLDLAGVACTAGTACRAVGTYNDPVSAQRVLGEGLSGTTWSLLSIPDDTFTVATTTNSVACVSSTDCVAVGNVQVGGGSGEPAIEQWNGASWSVQQLVSLDQLNSVSCSSATQCLAVGVSGDGRSGTGIAAAALSGTTWSALTVPTSIGFGVVSCPATNFCMTDGSSWNGSTWTAHVPPNEIIGTGISCTSSTNCIDVGWTNDGSGSVPAADRWNGTTWTALSPVDPAGGGGAQLSGVACITATDCVAVGESQLGSLVETWNGTTWSIQSSPSSGGTNIVDSLSSVACNSATSCTAVGLSDNTQTFDDLPLVETWNGTAWSVQPSSTPSGSTSSQLKGVACFTATTCQAVGTYTDADGNTFPFDEQPGTGPTVPNPPTIGTVGPGTGSAMVSWTAPLGTGGSPLTGYVVTPYVGTTAQTAHTFTTTATTETITGLTNGTTYTFKVAATNAVGTGGQSAASVAITVGAPAAPVLQSATPGNTTAKVSWFPQSANAAPLTGYTIIPLEGGTVPLDPQTFDSTANSETVTGLFNSADYTFEIAAINSFGTGAFSRMTPDIIAGAPLAPSLQSASPGNATATVVWWPPSGNGQAVSGYDIIPYLGTTAQATQTFTTATAHDTVTGLTNGKTYTFKIAAINSNGAGPLSAATAPIIVGAPAAPASVTAAPGTASAKVSWTAPAANASAITGYSVTPYIGATAQAVQTFATTATSDTVTGLTNGTAYTFKVAATNSLGGGPASAASAAVTVGAPGAPGLQSAQPGNGSASVVWWPGAANASAITGYVITPYLGTVAQPSQTFASTAAHETVTGLTNGSSYTFKVAGINSFGTGPTSPATAAIVVGAPVAPAAPAATAGTKQASVTWTAPVSNGFAITGYTVTPFKAGVAQAPVVFASTAITQVITGLTTGTAYTFKVAATNANGTGSPSAASNSVTPT